MPTRRGYLRGRKLPEKKVAPPPAPAPAKPVATTTPTQYRGPRRGPRGSSPAQVAKNRAAVKNVVDTVKGGAWLAGAKATDAFIKAKGPQPTTAAGMTIAKNLTGKTAKAASVVPAPKVNPNATPVSKAVSDEDFDKFRRKMYGLPKQ